MNIQGLGVKVESAQVLMHLDFVSKPSEIHAIMGPNGSGKSTLAQVIAGNPVYQVTGGDIVFDGQSIASLTPDERSKLGIFASFQHPPEIPGVNVAGYLRMIYTKRLSGEGSKKSDDGQSQIEIMGNQAAKVSHTDDVYKEDGAGQLNKGLGGGKNSISISPIKFRELLKEKLELLDMDRSFLDRYLNEGFSGGEKKKMELLQMLVLEPRLVILDEIDSGLDIDALKCVARAINWLRQKNPETAFIIITHHARILDHINPDFVHIMKAGKIVKSGGFELVKQLEKTGYKEFGEEFGQS